MTISIIALLAIIIENFISLFTFNIFASILIILVSTAIFLKFVIIFTIIDIILISEVIVYKGNPVIKVVINKFLTL